LFNKIERGEYRMARHFTDPVKDIIGKMLQIEPDKRITLEIGTIGSHPWFRGTLSDQEVKDIFQHRAKEVASDKQVEGAISQAEESKGGEDRAKQGQQQQRALDAFQLMSMLTQGSFSPFMGGADQKQDAQITISSRCIIKYTGSCVAALKVVLDSIKGNPKEGKAMGEIKGFINGAPLLTYVATIHEFIPITDKEGKPLNLAFVEFRRGRGTHVSFSNLWDSVLYAMRPGSDVFADKSNTCELVGSKPTPPA